MLRGALDVTETTREEDENAALAMIPIAKEIMDFCRRLLPADQDFGVFIPVRISAGEVRIIAMTTNRDRMAPYAARWALDVHQRPTQDDA
jgi:hypothetical protein